MKFLEVLMPIVSALAVLALVYLNYQMYSETRGSVEYLKNVVGDLVSYKLYDPENDDKFSTQGVYFPSKDYYCVKTEGRDWTDIKMTDYHEMCHAFVDMDYQHFCNDSNQTEWKIENYIRG